MTPRKRLTQEEFLRRARIRHGDKYDYSYINYKNMRTKVEIVCPLHGTFWQLPQSHIAPPYNGCIACGIEKKAKNQIHNAGLKFPIKASKVHSNKYDYSAAKYQGINKKLAIKCPEHGTFYQSPKMHLEGQGCPTCGIIRQGESKAMGLDEFLTRAKDRHGSKFDYNRVHYKNINTEIEIRCPIHGWFFQTPAAHLQGEHGCGKCSHVESRKTVVANIRDKWEAKAREVHGDKYDYSLVDYTRAKAKITIICPEHGPFEQVAWNHTAGVGCPDCAIGELSKEERHIRARTRTRTFRALRDGSIQPKSKCEVCGIHPDEKPLEMHHVSYERDGSWNDIEWLCRDCHMNYGHLGHFANKPTSGVSALKQEENEDQQ